MKEWKMKKVCFAAVALILVLTTCFALAACEQEPVGTDGLEYTLSDDGATYSVSGIGTATDTDIVIPATYDNKPVTKIDKEAFRGCTNISNVIIPDSVTEIDSNAFDGCSSLQYNEHDNALYLGNKNNPYHALIKAKNDAITSCEINENTKVIAIDAFRGCESLINVTVPNSIIVINYDAFAVCHNLQYNEYDNAVYLGNNDNPYLILVKSKDNSISSCIVHEQTKIIGNFAFYRNDKLTSLTIGNNVTHIGNSAFDYCLSLTDVTIPDSVKFIGDLAFNSCISLANVKLGREVKAIGTNAFAGTGISSITIPSGVTLIGRDAFIGCANLTGIVVDEANSVYHSANNCLIETATKTLIYGCKTSEIPTDGSVTKIAERAFYFCKGLTSITIPEGITEIGNYAFQYSDLTSIVIANSVTKIGDLAFYSCINLTEINFNGTMAQWNAISFGDGWNSGKNSATKIICTDGEIEL